MPSTGCEDGGAAKALIEDPELREQVRRAAWDPLKEYTVERMVDEVEERYVSALRVAPGVERPTGRGAES